MGGRSRVRFKHVGFQMSISEVRIPDTGVQRRDTEREI